MRDKQGRTKLWYFQDPFGAFRITEVTNTRARIQKKKKKKKEFRKVQSTAHNFCSENPGQLKGNIDGAKDSTPSPGTSASSVSFPIPHCFK